MFSQFMFGQSESSAGNETVGENEILSIQVMTETKNLQDSSFSFTRLLFHTSTCFGSCPVIHLEISSDKSIRFSGNYLKDENFSDIDSIRTGNFSGQLSDELFDEMIDLIIKSKITELDQSQDQILCCDGAIKTLILYHNDSRTYYKTMFEPKVLRELISFLYEIDKNVNLTMVEENFAFEK